ncbi:hypothetical protein [Kocuria turfanensis]|uniref:Uncharacterized protein n=1 Tax=Kocuria turfanensis TaxID=388357 RepID=A0A512IGR4_9MICC|nr:hypothetical protein [Kocuria turfanensis]GEO96850.1 hypothetical protein KTU01_29730 [Kocuria turfanensis]
MSVEIDDQGTVTSGGRPVDYATAYGWAVDSPETITDLVHDTKAFVTVIAAAEHASREEQAAAVRKAFAAGVPRQPGASWAAAAAQGTTPSEPAASDPAAGPQEPVSEEGAPQEPAADKSR